MSNVFKPKFFIVPNENYAKGYYCTITHREFSNVNMFFMKDLEAIFRMALNFSVL